MKLQQCSEAALKEVNSLHKKKRLLFRDGLAISIEPMQRSRHMEICMGINTV